MPQQGDTLSSISHEVARELLECDTLDHQGNPFNCHGPRNDTSGRSQYADKQLRQGSGIKRHRSVQSSGTWTTASREAWSEQDEIDGREAFVEEYNRLAKKYGVRLLKPNDYDIGSTSVSEKPGSWFSRMLRRTSSTHSTKLKIERQLSHKRSISDISIRGTSKTKHTLKDKSLQDLVRLCGLSIFYLPTDYAPCSLTVPTCFRATAQYLVQHGPAVPGVFRIPGSSNIVAALYDHYCPRGEEADIAGTVRCPALPQHIKYDVHDVASTFKRFLSGVPGGILGSLALFNMLVSIQNQFHADPELPAKKRDQIRSRLIALAVATLKSQYRRELICTVFGLLSMIGHAAESEEGAEQGELMPPSDLMGYGPLGIVFGPLLIGELLDDYNLGLPNPYGGLIVLPISPPKSRKEKQKERQKDTKTPHENASFTTHVDKIKIVNSITEMLIVHWQEVVVFMKISQALKVGGPNRELTIEGPKRQPLRPSASEAFPRDVRSHEPNVLFAEPHNTLLANEDVVFSPSRMRSKSQPLFRKRISAMRSTGTLIQAMGRTSESTVEPTSSTGPSNEAKLPHESLVEKPIDALNELVPVMPSNQYTPRRSATRNRNLRPKSHGHERSHDRILRLPRKKSARSLPEQHDQQEEEHSSSADPFSSAAISEATTAQVIEPAEWFGNVAPEPGFWLSDTGILPTQSDERYSPSITSTSSRLRARPFIIKAPTDPLSNVSPEEDLASLAALAQVLSQDSGYNRLGLSTHRDQDDQEMSVAENTSRNTFCRGKGKRGSSSSSTMNPILRRGPTISGGQESSGSSSSPLSMFVSKRRKGANTNRHSKISPVKPVESGSSQSEVSKLSLQKKNSTDKISNRFSLFDPKKSTGQQLDSGNPVRASPRGTVKALVAKFSLAAAPIPLASPASRSYASTIPVSQELRKSSIVSPYTKNHPSSIRSQRSGISDKTIKVVQNQPKLNIYMQSPNKNSPFSASIAKKQSQISIGMNLPSHTIPKSLERMSISPKDSLANDSRRRNYRGREIRAYSSAKAPRQVKEAPTTHEGMSDTDTAHNQLVAVAASESVKRILTPNSSNSELRVQIQTLQRQLAAKTEEAQQLRSQVDTGDNFNAGALDEDITEAKREVQFWKSRAESYEKQVEMMKQTSSHQPIGPRGQSYTPTMNMSEDKDTVVHRDRRALRAVDGASSWYSQGSGRVESTGALSSFENAVSLTDNGSWLEQTMRALRRTES